MPHLRIFIDAITQPDVEPNRFADILGVVAIFIMARVALEVVPFFNNLIIQVKGS